MPNKPNLWRVPPPIINNTQQNNNNITEVKNELPNTRINHNKIRENIEKKRKKYLEEERLKELEEEQERLKEWYEKVNKFNKVQTKKRSRINSNNNRYPKKQAFNTGKPPRPPTTRQPFKPIQPK